MDDAQLKKRRTDGEISYLLLYKLDVAVSAVGGTRHFLHELEKLT
jgi:hypothetical protein